MNRVKIFYLIVLLRVFAAADVTEISKVDGKAMPELVFLTPGEAAPKMDVKRIVADSARILSPRVRAVISADTVLYEIEPMPAVDSVMLFVTHSQGVVDTLGVLSSPPYTTVWRRLPTASQDQMHLQFGYVLYCPDSTIITSPPLPHRWVLDRGGINPSPKSYRIKQLTLRGDFEADADLAKWKDARAPEGHIAGKSGIGDVAKFKLLWTAAKLHFIIDVKDNSVTAGDFVELHLDFRRDRAMFSGVNHRSLRFSPRGRSASFVVDLTDSGFVYNDSVNALLSEEMQKASAVYPSGYVIEAAVPITLISDFEFPPSKIGFDVSVINVDQNGMDTAFYSWSGSGRFSRYSPRAWGGAKITQAAAVLKAIFISTFLVTGLVIAAFLIYTVVIAYEQRRNEKMKDGVYSHLSESVIGDIEKDNADINGDDDDDDYDGDEVRRRWR